MWLGLGYHGHAAVAEDLVALRLRVRARVRMRGR